MPSNQDLNQSGGIRWLRIQLIGEGQRNGKFERGISQYPTIGDKVHLVSESDLRRIYGQPDKPYFVKVGHIAGAESIPALVDINKLITRHCAVLGATGSGKSTTVASIINSLSNPEVYPSARILILDIHGEYSRAMRGRSNVFKINADLKQNEKELYLPFWALNYDELTEISFGSFSNEKDRNIVLERILNEKKKSISVTHRDGVTIENINVDTPIPFSLNHLWYQLYLETFATYYKSNAGIALDNLAYELNAENIEIKGDPYAGIPPSFKKVKNEAGDPVKINFLPEALSIGQQLRLLGAKLRIPRYDFMFRPGDWSPDETGGVNKDLDVLIEEWIGGAKPVTILDLSGVPVNILNLIIGVLLRILYDALFWARKLQEGGRNRPLLIVMEEAHNYLNDNFSGLASIVVQRIVKEGRKYGIGAMIVSQRPSEINSTVLSQCGTFFALRLSNSNDRAHITSTVTDNLEGLTNMLPILRTGEAIILGESVKLPMRCLISAPDNDKRPDSFDPIIYAEKPSEESDNVGGWGIKRVNSRFEYEKLLKAWRTQNPRSSEIINSQIMDKISVSSSTLASIGYDAASETLEVDFNGGSTYQYFNVPEQVADEFINRPTGGSHGKHLAEYIKGNYRFSKL